MFFKIILASFVYDPNSFLKSFGNYVPQARISSNCNLLQSVVYQKPLSNWKKFVLGELSFRNPMLVNNGLEEGRTHRDSNSEHRTERPIGYHYTLGPSL